MSEKDVSIVAIPRLGNARGPIGSIDARCLREATTRRAMDGVVLTGTSIAGEVACPLNECGTLVLAASDWVALDCAHDTAVVELGLSCDD